MCNAKLPQGCTFKGDCLPVEGRVCEGCPHMPKQTRIKEIVQQAILKVTGCKDLKSGELYLSEELTKAVEAHDQQVRKEFAEKVEYYLLHTADNDRVIFAAHIRALAEEGR